jgi:hypothetical protein
VLVLADEASALISTITLLHIGHGIGSGTRAICLRWQNEGSITIVSNMIVMLSFIVIKTMHRSNSVKTSLGYFLQKERRKLGDMPRLLLLVI